MGFRSWDALLPSHPWKSRSLWRSAPAEFTGKIVTIVDRAFRFSGWVLWVASSVLSFHFAVFACVLVSSCWRIQQWVRRFLERRQLRLVGPRCRYRKKSRVFHTQMCNSFPILRKSLFKYCLNKWLDAILLDIVISGWQNPDNLNVFCLPLVGVCLANRSGRLVTHCSIEEELWTWSAALCLPVFSYLSSSQRPSRKLLDRPPASLCSRQSGGAIQRKR